MINNIVFASLVLLLFLIFLETLRRLPKVQDKGKGHKQGNCGFSINKKCNPSLITDH